MRTELSLVEVMLNLIKIWQTSWIRRFPTKPNNIGSLVTKLILKTPPRCKHQLVRANAAVSNIEAFYLTKLQALKTPPWMSIHSSQLSSREHRIRGIEIRNNKGKISHKSIRPNKWRATSQHQARNAPTMFYLCNRFKEDLISISTLALVYSQKRSEMSASPKLLNSKKYNEVDNDFLWFLQ